MRKGRYIHMYIYIYIERERARERESEKERERERLFTWLAHITSRVVAPGASVDL